MVNEIKRVNDLIAEITLASREQAAGIADVGNAVAQIDQSTQQNAAMVEQSSAAAACLSDEAQRLLDAIQVFSLEDQQINGQVLLEQSRTRQETTCALSCLN